MTDTKPTDTEAAEAQRLQDLEAKAAAVRADATPDPEPTPEDTPAPVEKDEAYREAERAAAHDAEARDGAVIDPGLTTDGEPAFVVKSVVDSAPENVSTDQADGMAVTEGTLAASPATMAQQKAPRLKGEGYAQGYYGVLPDADNRPDLTLAGVLASQPADTRLIQDEDDTEGDA